MNRNISEDTWESKNKRKKLFKIIIKIDKIDVCINKEKKKKLIYYRLGKMPERNRQ
jgi:hypothetical protein